MRHTSLQSLLALTIATALLAQSGFGASPVKGKTDQRQRDRVEQGSPPVRDKLQREYRDRLPGEAPAAAATPRQLLPSNEERGVEPPPPGSKRPILQRSPTTRLFDREQHRTADLQLRDEIRRDPEYVQWVQESLNRVLREGSAGGLEVDGLVGPKTRAFTKEFQRERGLEPDGIFGPETERQLTQISEQDPPSILQPHGE